MRGKAAVLVAISVTLGCRSTPFPPAPDAALAPAAAARRPAPQPRIVPLPGRPGFQVCTGCEATRPTPKTLASGSAAPPPANAASGAGVQSVIVRYAASVPFAFNSASIAGAAQNALDSFVARLPAGARTSLVSVSGRTDNIGPRAANEQLARARAEAVLTALRPRLTPQAEDIRAEPLCCYIASNATAAGRADNRRVDVVAIVAIE